MGVELVDEKQASVHQEDLKQHDARRSSITGVGAGRKSSFDSANLNMVLPDKTHGFADGTTEDSIEDIPISWFVWLVAFTASVAGSLFVSNHVCSVHRDNTDLHRVTTLVLSPLSSST